MHDTSLDHAFHHVVPPEVIHFFGVIVLSSQLINYISHPLVIFLDLCQLIAKLLIDPYSVLPRFVRV